MDLTYTSLFKSESRGGGPPFGIQILVAGFSDSDLHQSDVQTVVNETAGKIEDAVMSAILLTDKPAMEKRKKEREELLGLFSDPIFVEEIPNGYCSSWCCRHRPWFVVTTRIGRFKLGWRKRVIHLEWTETVGTKTAQELFPREDVTKGERYIHAWSLDKARYYVNTIFLS